MTRRRNARKRVTNGVHRPEDEPTGTTSALPVAAAAEPPEPPAPDDESAADTDDTGTFMALDETDEDHDNGEALMSLQRLEGDIRELHARWADVESELAARDMEIRRLHEDHEVQHAAFKSLQAELDESSLREDEARAEIDALRASVDELGSAGEDQARELAARDAAIASGEAALADMRGERDSARQDCAALETKLAEHQAAAEASQQQTADQLATVGELRVQIQEFEAYIDRRKADWDNLNADLAQYRDALAGMEQSLADKAGEFQHQEEEKIQLSAAVIDLEKRCAELDGRRAEREQANQELQNLLNERAREIETLKISLQQAEQAGTPLQDEIKTQQSALAESRAEIVRLEQQLIDAKAASAESLGEFRQNADTEMQRLQARLDDAEKSDRAASGELAQREQRITDLQAELNSRQAQLDKVWEAAAATDEKLGRTADERDALQAERDDVRERLTALESEFADYRRVTSLDLEASTQQAAELAAELKERNAALLSLNRNVKIVDKINASVQRLDKQMSGSGHDSPQQAGDTAAEQRTRRLMIAIQGQKKIRYPIYKDSMTIGRSPDNDIQIRQKWISRQHARILIDGEAVTIEDMGSKNGILVNNQPVSSLQLNDQDMVDIGETRFQFVDLMHKSGNATA